MATDAENSFENCNWVQIESISSLNRCGYEEEGEIEEETRVSTSGVESDYGGWDKEKLVPVFS